MPRLVRQVLVTLASIAGLYALNLILNLQRNNQPAFDPFFLRILLLSGIYVTLAVSLNIVNGFTGQFSIGHAGFMAIGAYSGAAISYKFPNMAPGPLIFAATLTGGLIAAIFGFLVGAPSLRLRGDYLAIVTLGFGEIIRVLLENTDKIPALSFMGGAVGFNAIPHLTSFFWVIGLAALAIAVSRNLKRSIHGLAFLSVRENEIAADAMGVDTTRVKVTAFVVAAFFAGAAGALYAHNEQFIIPATFNFILSINIVVMIVLGGLGSITGAAITACVFTALPEFLRNANSGPIARFYKDEYRLVAFALLLTATMILRPQGLLGTGELTIFRRRAEDRPPPENGTETKPRSVASERSALECVEVSKRFGGLVAVDGLNIELANGELVGLIGPNGAGKTTVFNLLTGVYEPTNGTIACGGVQYSGDRPIPAARRALLLTWDALLASIGGFIIGTAIFSSVTPLQISPDALGAVFPLALHSVITWTFILGALTVSLATAPRRRRARPALRPNECSRLGIARTFQNIRLFPQLTVLENVLVGSYGRRRTGIFDAFLQSGRLLREERDARARARSLLIEFGLAEDERELARNLPYGDQRRLEIVRALMTRPKLLLLDEPAAGMNPREKVELMALIRRVRDEYDLTVLLIEHDMKLVMGICERIYVLDYGRVIAEGIPEEIRANPVVIAAYLGEEVEEVDASSRA